jgi:hypothetical protein
MPERRVTRPGLTLYESLFRLDLQKERSIRHGNTAASHINGTKHDEASETIELILVACK